MLNEIKAWVYHTKQFVNPIRPTINKVKSLNLEEVVGVEIGTYVGHNALNILENLDIKKLYLIDPYTPYEDDYGWRGDVTTLNEASLRLKNYSNKIHLICKKSSDAINDIPNNLDFVYIDGNHRYEYVHSDILNYYPKVRSGGIIGGHDIYLSGVMRAVSEFCNNRSVDLQVKQPDWWFVKE